MSPATISRSHVGMSSGKWKVCDRDDFAHAHAAQMLLGDSGMLAWNSGFVKLKDKLNHENMLTSSAVTYG